MHCLICNSDIATHNGFNQFDVLCTELPSGALLSIYIGKILKRIIEPQNLRSTNLCKRCFSLFNELDIAESRCTEIKHEVESYYLKTCQIYEYEHPLNTRGVACQTDIAESTSSPTESEKLPNIRLKIALPKRKRGRPVKAQSQSRKNTADQNSLDDIETPCIQKPKRRDKQPKKEAEITPQEADEVVEVRRTRSGGRGTRKKNSPFVEVNHEKIKHEEIDLNEENPLESVFVNAIENDVKEDETSPDNGELITGDAFNSADDDDDDFEWKEEPATDMNDDSEESENEIKEEKGNEDDWQSSGSKDSKKKQKKKKKRKRGDRKGERAFMVPIHACNQCGKKWRTVTELKSHIASHSDVRPFVCEICGQAYKMKKALDIHIGMHNGIHPFVCSYCNKSFTQKVGLEKHLPIHTGVTRFQCDLCGKRFIHQKSFNIHKMTHTGEKNIHCPICKLAVFSQSHLKRHYRVHTGERPYGCTICGKKFAEKYNLNAHSRIHDPNSAGEGRRRSHTCPICGISYDRKHKMADHLSSAHYIWQTSSSTNMEFKTEDFYNIDVQQGPNQHHMQAMQAQQQSLPSASAQQQQNTQQQQQQQPLVHQQQVAQQQATQMSTQQQTQPTQIRQLPQQAQPTTQMVPGHQPQQHHHMTHHQQLQQHHTQTATPHHILVTQHQIQQTLQTHLAHHPNSAATATIVATATPPPLQPINSVFQLVSVQPAVTDPSTVHQNRLNAVTASMAVPTL